MKRGVLLIVGVVFLIVFGVVAFLASRGNKVAPGETVLKVWAPYDEETIYEDLSVGFQNAYPGVRVDFTYIKEPNAKEYEAAVVDAIASGKGPDVWLIRTDWLPKHETKLAPMPSTLRWSTERGVTDQAALENLYGGTVVSHNTLGGQLLGLPLWVDSLALYVNQNITDQVRYEFKKADDPRQDMFKNYPKTWSQVEEWSRTLTVKSKNGFTRSGLALGTLDNISAPVDIYNALLYQKGGSLFNPTNREAAIHLAKDDGSVPAQQALEFFASFSNPAHPNYSWNKSAGDMVKQFVDGKLAMMIGYSTLRFEIFQQNKDFQQYYIVPLPQLQEQRLPTDTRTDYSVYWTHVVPKTSANTQLAWQYIQYITQPEVQELYTDKLLKPTINMVNGEVDVPKNDNLAQPLLFAEQVPSSPMIFKPEWQFVDETLQTMIRSVIEGGQTLQTAVDTAATSFKEIKQ